MPTYGSGPYEYMPKLGMLCIQAERDIGLLGIITSNMSYVHMARNCLVKMARRQIPKPTHLMFIDQDCALAPDTITRLASFDKPIIGAVYYKKAGPYTPIVYHLRPSAKFYDEDMPGPDSPPFHVKHGGVGMGATLIRMDVFDEMEKAFEDSMWYQCPSFIAEDGRDAMMGEDIFFCDRLDKLGIEVWCDPSDQVEHIGNIPVCGELFRVTRSMRAQEAAA